MNSTHTSQIHGSSNIAITLETKQGNKQRTDKQQKSTRKCLSSNIIKPHCRRRRKQKYDFSSQKLSLSAECVHNKPCQSTRELSVKEPTDFRLSHSLTPNSSWSFHHTTENSFILCHSIMPHLCHQDLHKWVTPKYAVHSQGRPFHGHRPNHIL